jgi:hypothetical protein
MRRDDIRGAGGIRDTVAGGGDVSIAIEAAREPNTAWAAEMAMMAETVAWWGLQLSVKVECFMKTA